MKTNIKKYIDVKGYTANKLAVLSGVKPGRLHNIISGKTDNPGIKNMIKLADALDVSLDELVGRKRIK